MDVKREFAHAIPNAIRYTICVPPVALYNIFNRFRLVNHVRKEVKTMMSFLRERGQGMVEYGMILVLVAVVVVIALTAMGPLVRNMFSTINASL